MSQRLTKQRHLFIATETTEGEAPAGTYVPIAVTNLVAAPDLALYARSMIGTLGRVKAKPGAQPMPGLAFTMDCLAGKNGSQSAPTIDPLLAIILGPGRADSGPTDPPYPGYSGFATVQANGANTKSFFHVDNAHGYSIGNAIAVETVANSNSYEVGWVTAVDTTANTISLSSDLSFANPPAGGERIRPSMTYRPMDTGHGSFTARMWLDTTATSSYVDFVGTKATLKFDVPAPGTVPKLTVVCRAMSWAQGSGAYSAPTYDSSTPPTPHLFKVGGAPTSVKIASWDLRQAIARKLSQNSSVGTVSQVVTDRDLRGFFQAYNDSSEPTSQLDSWLAGTEQEVSHQFGTSQFGIVAYRIPKAQRLAVAYGDDNGLTTDDIAFEGNVTNGADEIQLAFL